MRLYIGRRYGKPVVRISRVSLLFTLLSLLRRR